MAREFVECKGERRRRGVVAGEDERHQRVPELLVGHRRLGARPLADGDERREQVVRVGRARRRVRRGLVEQVGRDLAEALAAGPEAPARGRRNPRRERVGGGREPVVEPSGRVPDRLVAADGELAPEQRREQHVERQVAGLALEVDRLAGRPPRDASFDLGGHLVGVRPETVAREGRLERRPLAPPRLALGRHQPGSEGEPEVVGLAERAPVVDEGAFEVRRVGEVVDVAGAEKPDPRDVVVGERPVPEAEHVRHRPDRVRQRVADSRRIRRERRVLGGTARPCRRVVGAHRPRGVGGAT